MPTNVPTTAPTNATTNIAPSTTPNQNITFNNGGAVIKCGENTYYITDSLAYEDYRSNGALYSVNTEGISRKLANIGGKQIWAIGNWLYVSSDNLDNLPYSTYKVNRSDGKTSILFDGTIDCFGPDNKTIYYTGYAKALKENPTFQGLYKFNLETLKIEKIVDANNTIDSEYLTAINGKMYYYTTTKNNAITINCYDMKSGDTTTITTDKTNRTLEDYSYTVPQLSACGEWLIYCVGDFEGSGHYFYGDMYRMKPDGTNKASMNISPTGYFLANNIWIYYTDSSQEKGCPSYIIHPDLSGKQEINNSISPITITEDGWMYFSSKNGDIHRSRMDGSSDNLILKANKLPNHLTKDDLYNYTLNFVGDTLYINAEVWGYRSWGSWRNQFINSSFNRININKTGFQTLSQIHGPTHK